MVTSYESNGYFERMTTRELIRVYNELNPRRPVKSFASHGEGVQHCLELISRLRGRVRNAGRKGNTTKVWNCPARPPVKVPNPGTQRWDVMNHIKTNHVTRLMVQENLNMTRWQVYNLMWILHNEYGYGFTEDKDGFLEVLDGTT